MSRKAMPKKVKENILDEYDHRCAVCGGDRPHIHHIDENPSNNNLDNLLPLCPNCHLRDQHNPTRKIEIPKLKLFRKYKDPAILKPQFHPLYVRQLFLDEVEVNTDGVSHLVKQSRELVEFVASFEMGEFYSRRIYELIRNSRLYVKSIGSGSDFRYRKQRNESNRAYRQDLIENKDAVRVLIVELLRYQNWANS